jgi:hypothetical protein
VPLHRYINGEAYATAEDSLRSVLCLLEACPELGLSSPLHKPEQTKRNASSICRFWNSSDGARKLTRNLLRFGFVFWYV